MSTDVNVKVAVRCRPMSSRETQMGSQTIIQVVEGKTIVITNPDANASKNDPEGQTKQFTFDFSYFTDSTQAQVYKDIAEPIIQQAIQGYNGTIFAYGQTGSGKTHTMLGTGNDLGIIPLMNVDLFQRIENISKENNHQTKFLVTVSFLEIYNEVIKDLLNPSDKVLKIREHPDMGIYVEHLAEVCMNIQYIYIYVNIDTYTHSVHQYW
jgi:kinesin family protein 1/kinesin family protein 3/17